MQIADLSYLDNVPQEELISGSAGVLVDATASASGYPSSTYIFTDGRAILLPSGVSLAFGRGLAVANGDNPTANVTVAGDGDIVVGGTRSRSSQYTAVARGFVIAIDLPNR
ncbi:MAG: hypothetical protein KME54_04870 [Tolypothrix brevis GSE-NOS-MK-07-07A]|jgi:hypothetical protein|nr:hypothetical protein [Tolypothrix brevis GSE-NOS-MK-07-07A]